MKEKIKRLRKGRGFETSEAMYERRWPILAVLCLALLVVMVGNTSLNVALPVLSRELQATNSQLQWLVDSYSLVFAGFLFTAGAVGDRYGRKGMLQAGLVLFGLASVASAFFINSAEGLIVARAVMGLAGAMIMPATLSILTNVFPTRERARAVGIWAGVSGAGVALGPLVTGFMLEHFSWHSVFMINLPVIVITLIAAALLVPKTSDQEHTNLDPIGAGLSITGLVAIVYALIEAPAHGWLSPETLTVGIAGLGIMAVFVWWELKLGKKAMLDVRLFKIPAFGISSLSLTLVFFSLMGAFFSFSQLLQLVYGFSPLNSAVRMLPMAFTMMTVAPLSTKIAERFGKRLTVSAGMATVAFGLFLVSRLGVDSSYLQLALSMVVLATGMSIAMSPTTDLLMSSVPKNRAGMGSAMNDTTRELGGSLGIAVLGSLLASQYSSKILPSLTALPENAKNMAEQSLTGALAVAGQIGGDAGSIITDAAKSAFVSGLSFSLVVGAGIVSVAAIIAYFGLPEKAHDHDHDS